MLSSFLSSFLFLSISTLISSFSHYSLPSYICTFEDDTKVVDYYSYSSSFSFPSSWSIIQRKGYCTSDCFPCEEYKLHNRNVMIGYSAECNISYENQLLYRLYNVTDKKNIKKQLDYIYH